MKFYLCGFKNDNVAEVRKHYLDFHNVDPNNQFFKRLFDESEDNVFRAGQCIRCKQFIPCSSSRKCHNFLRHYEAGKSDLFEEKPISISNLGPINI